MKFIWSIIMLLFSVNAFSQHKKISAKDKPASKIEIPSRDSVSMPKRVKLFQHPDVDFANKVASHTFLKDSVEYTLFDDPAARHIDSLWQLELYKSSLNNTNSELLPNQEYFEMVNKDLPTDTLKKRLQLMNAKTPFHIEYNYVLERVINSYLKRNKKNLENLMALSRYYFPIFEQRLAQYNIPLEIKYLAIVESALNPRAKSRMGATGLWQFMYATGKMHNLDVTSYVDERMDPIEASAAAAEYLASLYRVFGDWDLVLAAYNSGPGNVAKAIRRSGGSKNYWDLRPYLPRETAGYVPAFIATMYVFEFAPEHDFQPPKTQISYFETDTIHTHELLTFDQISELTGVDKELLQFLNPSYKLDVIPHITNKISSLRLPRNKIGLFINNEEDIYRYVENQSEEKKEKQLTQKEESRIVYRVKNGDFLGKIAEKYGVGVSKIKRWNNLRGNQLRVGQRLLIYADPVAANTSSTKLGSKDTPRLYTVKQGDSLWSISHKFKGLTVQQIKDWNKLDNNTLKPGMRLKLSNG